MYGDTVNRWVNLDITNHTYRNSFVKNFSFTDRNPFSAVEMDNNINAGIAVALVEQPAANHQGNNR